MPKGKSASRVAVAAQNRSEATILADLRAFRDLLRAKRYQIKAFDYTMLFRQSDALISQVESIDLMVIGRVAVQESAVLTIEALCDSRTWPDEYDQVFLERLTAVLVRALLRTKSVPYISWTRTGNEVRLERKFRTGAVAWSGKFIFMSD